MLPQKFLMLRSKVEGHEPPAPYFSTPAKQGSQLIWLLAIAIYTSSLTNNGDLKTLILANVYIASTFFKFEIIRIYGRTYSRHIEKISMGIICVGLAFGSSQL